MTRPTSRPVSRRGFIRSAGATAGLVAGGAWLAGCAPTTAPTPSKPAAAATSAPAGAPAVAKPASASTLKIGVLLPYSGVYAVLGESITNGMQMFFDGANNAAGGRSITLVKEDEGATPDMVAANLKLMLAAMKQHNPRMPIVLCQVFPSSEKMRRPADTIKAVNALYLAAVKGDPQVLALDTWTLFADATGDAPEAEFPDLLHLNEVGYAKWAAALRPIFATLGFSETAPDTFALEPGFESLFNGRDLTGWGYRPTSEADQASAKRWQASDPSAAEWPFVTEKASFDGLTATPDGRYRAMGGRLVVTTPPSYRRIQQLWTTREFPRDFVLKLEFRATPNADSGLYVRGPQLQVRDYLLAGPYKQLKSYRPQDWNEIVVTVQGGVARATCNGELLEAEMKVPASGPIGLEGDRGQMEYRRIRIQTR